MPRLQLHPYSIALLAAAVTAVVQASACWRRREARGAGPLTAMLLALAMWSAKYAVHFAVVDAGAQLLWLNLMFVGVVLVPPSFLVFAHAFVGDAGWLTRRRFLWLAVEPALVLAAVWTNPWHGAFYSHLEQVHDGAWLVLHWGRGWLYWLHVAYSYGLVLVGAVLLAHTFREAPQPYRRQVALMLGGLGAGTGVALVVYVRASPGGGADLTPLVFVACGLVLVRAMRTYGLFDVQPVARGVVVERLRDAVLVLDARARVLDANPAAARLLGAPSADALVGRPMAEVCAAWPALVAALERHDQAVVRSTPPEAMNLAGPSLPPRRRRADDLAVPGPRSLGDEADPNAPWFDVQVVPLAESAGTGEAAAAGERVLLFRDVSERRAAQRRLESANAQLELQLAENHRLQTELRRLAETDALTGAANRRRLDQALPRAAAEAAAADRPLAVVMADIDHFKRVNDAHGHEVGDRLLAALAATLRGVVAEQGTPGSDVFRYGGEEFALLLPGATPERARVVAEACRARFAGVRVAPADGGAPVGTTLSLGVAAVQPPYGVAAGGASATRPALDGAALLRAADRALYAAKAGGRNRVTTAGQGTTPPISAEIAVEAV